MAFQAMPNFITFLTGAISIATAQTFTIQLPDSIAVTNSQVIWEKRIAKFCEGPAYETSTGATYFTEQRGGADWPIWRIRPGVDTGFIFVGNRQNNGLEFDMQGRLLAAQDGRVTRYRNDGQVDSVLAQTGQNGVVFSQANDLSIGSNGVLYFTDHRTQVFRIGSNGLSVATSKATDANGIEWIEEANVVQVHESSQHLLRRFPVLPNGSLGDPAVFLNMPRPDGGTLDSHGNLYIASIIQGEVRVFNAQGDSLGFIRLGHVNGTAYDVGTGASGNVSNCAFGGPSNTILYMTGDGGLFSIQLRIPGRIKLSAAIRTIGLTPVRKSGIRIPNILGRNVQRWGSHFPFLHLGKTFPETAE
jgi:gluconolactonase